MANRRMFALSVIDTDDFQAMPLSTQAIYFHLALHADDDGFVGSPKRLLRGLGGGEDEMRLLVAKGYIIPFESGVCVIRHWRIHNYIQGDRYLPTAYGDEKRILTMDENRAYVAPPGMYPECIQSVSSLDTQVRLGKGSVVEDSLEVGEDKGVTVPAKAVTPSKHPRFAPPSLDEVRTYCAERKNDVDPERWMAYYQSNGWKVGKNPMKDWRAAVRTWERGDNNGRPHAAGGRSAGGFGGDKPDMLGTWDIDGRTIV